MTNQETILRRREADLKQGMKELARELAQTLVLLPHKGNCKCGMMLTEKDKKPNLENYCCPRCGESGSPMLLDQSVPSLSDATSRN